MKKVIVTGAGQGIGYAIAKVCVENGYAVVACDNSQTALENLKSKYNDINIQCLNVSDYAAVKDFFEQRNNNDHAQCLVNNAGIYPARNILDYTPADMQRVLSVNVLGSMYMTQFFAAKLMDAKQHGAIVNMSSVAQYGGSDAVYGASKGALAAFTRCCAMNFAPYIRVNAVAPGIVQTDMFANLPVDVLNWYRDTELVKQPLQADDVAKTVLFLLSDAGAHYTGATLDINNGFHRR